VAQLQEPVRDFVLLYINGERHEVRGAKAFLNLADYLRYEAALPGTKIVCAEGDCGACTVLYGKPVDGALSFKTLNSCIQPVFNMDGCVVVSVEGLAARGELSPVQVAMINSQGAQCGYCTPGMCNSLTYLAEKAKVSDEVVCEKKARNFLTGNLCRCTGYEPILRAAETMDLKTYQPLAERYGCSAVCTDLETKQALDITVSAKLGSEQTVVHVPSSLKGLAAKLGQGRLISGATDLGVLRNKDKLKDSKFISVSRVAELEVCEDRGDEYWIGARATWDQVEDLVRPVFAEFSHLIHVFASPQIKHVGTLAGNLVNASPIADSTPFMLVNDGRLVIMSSSGKTRDVALNGFYQGYKKIDLQSDEAVVAVRLPKNKSQQRIYKVSQRKDLDIATVNCAIRFTMNEGKLSEIRLAFGGVAATSVCMPRIEGLLLGQKLNAEILEKCDAIIDQELKPLSDVRSSAEYRLKLCKNLLRKWAHEISPENFV
jgi:xanthine dehydrogenase small subunit